MPTPTTDVEINAYFAERAKWSDSRRREVADSLAASPPVKAVPKLAIYVCGSLGRDEATTASDLDLFEIVDDEGEGATPISKVQRIEVCAHVIATHAKFGYEPPSNDALFVEVHSLKGMLEHLGGPKDDSENEFTARMLLLLESRPLYGAAAYDGVVGKIVDAYFRDYDDHQSEFRPVFLVNDVMRYWKTLCLNYEHRRNVGHKTAEQKSKDSRKNVKLKFSRLLICFSMIVPLASGKYTTKDEVVRLVKLGPLARLDDVGTKVGGSAPDLVTKLKRQYAEFLETDGAADFVKKLENKAYREAVFARGKVFADTMFELLETCGRSAGGQLRYVVV